MTIKTAAMMLGAALVIAGSPALASAAPLEASPVRLESVQITQSYGTFNDFAYPGLATVAFTNETAVPVTKVVFDLKANGNVIDRFTDVGSYREGALIKHSYQDNAINYNQNLSVESVTFADGSVWNNTDRVTSHRQSADK
jgi:hypothetical protein